MTQVYIPIPIVEIEETQETSSLTYKLDLNKGRIIGMVDGLQAVNQAIRKAIITPRFQCLIYDNQYGSEIEDVVIAKDATPEYVQAVIPGLIQDALKPDTRIVRVYDFVFNFEDDKVYIYFKADTIFGKTTIEEVF